MLIHQLLQQGQTELENNGVNTAILDAQLLLGHCLQKSRSQLFLAAAHHVEQSDYRLFWSFIDRRKKHEPVAYILGEREFWSLPFFVNTDVLIPRPETEFLLATVLKHVKSEQLEISKAVDLCSGSGVISVVLAIELRTKVYAIDCSEKALIVTAKNCRRHGVEKLVAPIGSDLFEGVSSDNTFSLIVSNPPYISREEMSCELDSEVIDYEPHVALDGGHDGLNLIRRIVGNILQYLTPNGMFFMEFGADQGHQVENLFSSAQNGQRFFETVTIYKDYSDRDRVLFAKVNNYSE